MKLHSITSGKRFIFKPRQENLKITSKKYIEHQLLPEENEEIKISSWKTS